MPREVTQRLTEVLTRGPAQLVQEFTKTERAHLYASYLTKETVERVMAVYKYMEQNPDDLGGKYFENNRFFQ